jgi:hypothetical protein
MSGPSVDNPADARKTVDKFVAMAHNNEHLMRFLKVTVDSIEQKSTTKLTLHLKSGEPKGGEANFSF